MAGCLLRQRSLFVYKMTLLNTAYFSTTNPGLIKWRYEFLDCHKRFANLEAAGIISGKRCIPKIKDKQGIEPNPNRYGKLTNLPDYSFLDGQPVPVGMNAFKKLKLQQTFCKKIVELSGEIDFALEKYNKMVEESKLEKQIVSEYKLKPKGKKHLQKQQKPKK